MVQEQSESSTAQLTEAESELYDRQIRLWGLESQMRLRSAKVFISGLSGIGAEITKNIILSGVNSVKLHDEKLVGEEEVCSQFLVSRESVGVNRAVASIERARRLNPMVEISADIEPLNGKGEDYFAQFDVVVISGVKSSELIRIDNLCRAKDVKFFAVDVWGMFGYCFADLQEYTFVEEVMKHKPVQNQKAKTELVSTTVKKELSFPPLQEIFDFDFNCQKFQRNIKRFGPAFVELRILHKFRETNDRDPSYKSREEDILKLEQIRDELIDSKIAPPQFTNVFSQISPATAIVGGIVAQEVIKAVTKKDTPVRNVFLFDPENCCGFVEFISTNSS